MQVDNVYWLHYGINQFNFFINHAKIFQDYIYIPLYWNTTESYISVMIDFISNDVIQMNEIAFV